jgi:hypothetical protein
MTEPGGIAASYNDILGEYAQKMRIRPETIPNLDFSARAVQGPAPTKKEK